MDGKAYEKEDEAGDEELVVFVAVVAEHDEAGNSE